MKRNLLIGGGILGLLLAIGLGAFLSIAPPESTYSYLEPRYRDALRLLTEHAREHGMMELQLLDDAPQLQSPSILRIGILNEWEVGKIIKLTNPIPENTRLYRALGRNFGWFDDRPVVGISETVATADGAKYRIEIIIDLESVRR